MKDREDAMSFDFCYSDNPGAHERHLLRRENNDLFDDRAIEMCSDVLQEKQKLDHDILQQFLSDFRNLVNKSAQLKPNEDSDVILSVKNELDKLYSVSASVADDQRKIQGSIKTLIDLVMDAVKKGAGQDAQALQELEQEEAARLAHFAFLESQLVADLLSPESPIKDEDLLASLLSAEKDDLALAVQLFDQEQMPILITQGTELLDRIGSDNHISKATENLTFMKGYLEYLKQA